MKECLISYELLNEIHDDLIELLGLNEWMRNTTKTNKRYIHLLEKEIKEVGDILERNKGRDL